MKRSTTTRILSGLAAAIIVAAPLAACSGDADDAANAESTAPTSAAPSPEPEDAEEAEEESQEAPAAAGEATAPGTVLAFGEAATFPMDPLGEGEQNVNVKVIEVAEGDVAEAAALFDSEGQKALEGKSLWYVGIEIQGDPAAAYADVSSMDIGLYDQDGDDIRPLTVLGSFEPCASEHLGDDGAPVMTCVPFYGSSSQTPTAVHWQESSTPYDRFDGKPVVWER